MKQTQQQQAIEDIGQFVNRSIQDSLEHQEKLKEFVSQQRDGLGIADLGAKIAFQEGIIEGLKIVKIIVNQSRRELESSAQ